METNIEKFWGFVKEKMKNALFSEIFQSTAIEL
jgi:hypothetical protein